MKYVPKKHHLKGILAVIQNACMGLLLDRGLGKTGIMLAAFRTLVEATSVRRMLVVTSLRPAYEVWPEELAKWDEFRSMKMNVLHGPDKEAKFAEKAQIDVINPEGLPWLASKVMEGDSLPWDVLCLDESTMFKHTETVRFKILKPMLPFFKRRYILTGNPTPNGLLDLFGQMYILDLGHALGNYVTYFRLNYFNEVADRKYVIKPDGEARIFKAIRPYVLRMAAEDYIKLPKMHGAATGEDGPALTRVTLPLKIRKVYDDMELELLSKIEEGTVTAANAAAASGKCRQIASGGVYSGEGKQRKSHFLHDLKLNALEEMINEFDGVPAMVVYEYEYELERLQERFPGTPYIGGGVAPKRFKEILQEWNKGNLHQLFAQPVTVARGLNMQGTRANVVWHSTTWDQEIYDQLNSRCMREGQKYPVFINHIVAKDTIDEDIVTKLLPMKHRTSKRFLDAMKESIYRRRKAA